MYTVEGKLVGLSPIVFSKQFDETQGPGKPNKGESSNSDEYKRRVSYLKAHVDEKGFMYIPRTAIGCMLCTMAKKAGDKYKGNQTYAKLFETGIEVEDNVSLGVHISKSERLEGQFRISKDRDGRIFKSFPMLTKWEGRFKILVDDNRIPVEKVREYLETAGRRIGLGSFRREKMGDKGKFEVKNIKVGNMG